MKKKYYTGLGLIIFESIVSGAYTPVDMTWFILRAGLVLVYVIASIVDRRESANVIAWLPIATIALSLLSVDSKYKALESEKLKSVKSDYVTSVKSPSKPVLPNCEGLIKWRLDECQGKVEKLQLAYNASLEKYNNRIIKSETKIETAKVELSLQEQIPVFIYVFFICGLSFISFVSVPRDDIKQVPSTEKTDPEVEQKDERQKIVNRILAGRSNLSIAEELGIDRRKIARIKNEIEQWKHNTRPTNAQLDKKIVSIREVKKGIA